MKNRTAMTNSQPLYWLWLNITALAFALGHVFIDLHIGLFGETSFYMSPLQAANIFFLVLINVWWIACLVLAAHNKGDGQTGLFNLSGAFSIAFVWAFLGNGLVALAAAPPPSAAFPYQDITHFGSLIFGGLAAWTTWKEIKARSKRVVLKPILAVGLLIFLAMIVNGVLTLSTLQG